METLQFQPNLSNLQRLQDEQLLRDIRAYNKGALALSAAEVTRGRVLLEAELARQVVVEATAIVVSVEPAVTELSAV